GGRGRGAISYCLAWLIGFGMLLPAQVAMAQQGPGGPGLPTPRLYVVMPNGGRIGSTFEATVTGADLDEPQGLLFSQPGIKAEPIAPPAPPPPDPKKPPAAANKPPPKQGPQV